MSRGKGLGNPRMAAQVNREYLALFYARQAGDSTTNRVSQPKFNLSDI
ncbi:hypothetical protein QFZ30_003650 [Arthrobacter pascens]|nr:hypothetical protein [Arthrobacter pascens]